MLRLVQAARYAREQANLWNAKYAQLLMSDGIRLKGSIKTQGAADQVEVGIAPANKEEVKPSMQERSDMAVQMIFESESESFESACHVARQFLSVGSQRYVNTFTEGIYTSIQVVSTQMLASRLGT